MRKTIAEHPNLDELQAILGFRFRDRFLLETALTHRSFLNENPDLPDLTDNERLEFLGDAVLDFVVGDYLFHRFPDYREGDLTLLRAALVQTRTLAKFAGQIRLGEFIRMGRGEEQSGGRQRKGLLADAFEALIGAIYLDQGLNVAQQWLVERFIEPALAEMDVLAKDPKSRFQEEAQTLFGITPVYELVSEEGPDHAKVFTMQVRLGDEVWGVGRGRSKQEATQAAAEEALRRLAEVEFADEEEV